MSRPSGPLCTLPVCKGVTPHSVNRSKGLELNIMPSYSEDTSRGTFSNNTWTKRSGSSTVSMFDASQPVLDVDLGPCEDESIHDQVTAQKHYFHREIKIRDPRGVCFEPSTSYKHHYPEKPLPSRQGPQRAPILGAPFEASSEYTTQYHSKPISLRPVEPAFQNFRATPLVPAQTTNARVYKAWPGAYSLEAGNPATIREASPAPELLYTLPLDQYTTSHAAHYPPKKGSYVPQTGEAVAHPLSESRVRETTHNHFYKPLALGPANAGGTLPRSFPEGAEFAETTTYSVEFVPKELPHDLPHLSGLLPSSGIRLPLPRRSLGVETLGDRYFVLIPFSAAAPASARQIFTTVHDNQQSACILVLYGENPTASKNQLLGQFDMINIPPAPKDVPQIEVTYHLDADLVLTVEARDLDTGRHKLWKKMGGTVVLR